MKVAMVGWEFPPFMSGGLGVHCLELTTELAKMGVDIDFYMPHIETVEGPLHVKGHHKHVNVIEVEADPALAPYAGNRRRRYDEAFNDAVHLYNERLKAEFVSRDVDLVHAHDWITAPAALYLQHAEGLPLVWTCHSTEFDRSAGFYPQEWIARIEGRAAREADRVIAVSAYTANELARLYGAEPARVTPVHNGVDFSKFGDASRRDYSRAACRVLYLSRVSRQKGPMSFIRAAHRVCEVERDTTFVVAGKGEMVPEMIDYTIRNGISNRVTFTGFIPDAAAQKLYDQSDVYVLPSVSEPFGISVLEAMTSGLPTIVSKTTGVGEALSHVLRAHHWDTDEMADQILSLARHRRLRESLGRNGALEVRKFTWAATGRKTLAVYQRVLADRVAGVAP
ncbi:MAG: glycosyltransferase family 4 protein [Thermoplasmatota archaeon]